MIFANDKTEKAILENEECTLYAFCTFGAEWEEIPSTFWMAYAGRKNGASITFCFENEADIKEMFLLAVATSIDALAVGITFAFLDYPIVEAISIIGITTFIISVGGVYVGNFFGNKYKNKAEFAGGLILVLIGLRILLSHLGFI